MNREDLEKVIETKIRPGLRMDGGNIELVNVEDDKIYVRLVGACHGCPAAAMTLKMGVERILKGEFPELKEVIPM